MPNVMVGQYTFTRYISTSYERVNLRQAFHLPYYMQLLYRQNDMSSILNNVKGDRAGLNAETEMRDIAVLDCLMPAFESG